MVLAVVHGGGGGGPGLHQVRLRRHLPLSHEQCEYVFCTVFCTVIGTIIVIVIINVSWTSNSALIAFGNLFARKDVQI